MSSASPTPARILIVGGDSRIGRSLAEAHLAAGDRVTRTTRRAVADSGQVFLDLAAPRAIAPAGDFDVAYFCAAATGLARCETAQAETWHTNVEATFGLMCELSRRGTFIVFFSTNLVFDGSRPQIDAAAPLHPECEYGRQKAEVESRLRRERMPAAIVRIAKVLELDNPLFASWGEALAQGRPIEPFTDRVMAPVTLDLVVQAAVAAAARRTPRVVQVSAARDISYADAARHFARALGRPETLVQPRAMSEAQQALAYSAPHTSLAVGATAFPFGAPDPLEAVEFIAAYTALATPER